MKSSKSFMTCAIAGIISILGATGPAATPEGFAAMGKILPADNPYLVYIKKIINEDKWEEIIRDDEKQLPVISEEEKKSGFLIFSRHYLDPVYSSSVPEPYEVTKEIRLFACKGEYEPCSFAIYALDDLKNLRITAGDFIDEAGNLIDKSNMDIRVVRSLPYRIGKENKYEMAPGILEKHDSTDIKKGSTAQFWITVRIPENAVPGFYKTTLKIENSAATQASIITFRMRVLPIKLDEPEILYGMCYCIPSKKGMYPENIKKHFQDMSAHGMNSGWFWPSPGVENKDGKMILDFSKTTPQRCDGTMQSLDELMENYLAAGFTKPWICGSLHTIQFPGKLYSKEFDTALIDCLGQLEQHAKNKNWPTFYLQYLDEPGNSESAMQRAEYYWPLIKKNFPQIKIFSDTVSQAFKRLDPWVDIRGYHGSYVTEEEIRATEKSGDVFGFYNYSSMGRDPKWDRFRWGLYTDRINAKFNYCWVYAWPSEKDPLWNYVFCSPEGPIPTLAWEGVREGIDDIRYITTLKNLITKARQSKRPEWIAEANNAENELTRISCGIPFEGVRNQETVDAMDSRTFDVYRWKIATHIIKLQNIGIR